MPAGKRLIDAFEEKEEPKESSEESPRIGSSKPSRWKTLVHTGVQFPLPYEPKGFAVKIRGKPVKLSPESEEMLYAFAKKIGTPYASDPVFVSNFLGDLKKTLPSEYSGASIEDFDLSEIKNAIDAERAAREAMTKDEKKILAKKRKEERENAKELHGFAEVDGKRVERAGYVVEPAGLFMGRGAHPHRGKWKPQARPEDIVLNLGENVPVPKGNWKAVVHDRASTWLASWTDRLSGKAKYMWLSDLSEIRQANDMKKYDKASILAGKISKVRSEIAKGLNGKSQEKRKLALVAYLIDRLAMRVGDEKDKDEADTVGATTLRKEHVRLEGERKILFDFLGKDSVRWQKEIDVSTPEDSAAFSYFREALSKGKPGDLLFPGITSSKVNDFLSSYAKGLSAKVFRTYHATKAVEESLAGARVSKGSPDFEKVYFGRLANLSAAKVCNHKRTPPKGWEDSLKKKEEKLKELESSGKAEKIGRAKREIELAIAVRDYNLNTSLRNYIDPRVYANWAKKVGVDARKIYPTSLQKKFSWLSELKPIDKKAKKPE